MAASSTLLGGLPRYEVFLEKVADCKDMDVSACYTFLQLIKTGDELLSLDDAILTSLGTRHSRFTLLMLLRHCPEGMLTPAGLAERTGVTRATISGLVDILERDGLVERTPSPEDRRQTFVEPTAAGLEYLERIQPVYQRWIKSVIEPLTQNERELLVGLLEKVQARLAELAGTLPATAEQNAAA